MEMSTGKRSHRKHKESVNTVKKVAAPFQGSGIAPLIDLDILCTAYNVCALIKKLPVLSQDCELETAIKFIQTHVKNKKHFEEVLVEAQRRRNVERAKGVYWFAREVIPEQYEVFEWREISSEEGSDP